jgi:hypothetical protein
MKPPPRLVPVVSAPVVVVVVVVVVSTESDSRALDLAAPAFASGAVADWEQPATTASAATSVRALRSIVFLLPFPVN